MTRRTQILLVSGLPLLLLPLWWWIAPSGGGVGVVLQLYALIWLAVVATLSLRHLFRVFLWRVSRRLAFSYFLIGVVPIPLVVLLAGVVGYILTGFFLGHLYRTTTLDLELDLQHMARAELDHLLGSQKGEPLELAPASFALYRSGRRIAGDSRAPGTWRDFWPCVGDAQTAGGVPFFGGPDGEPTLLGCARSGQFGVLARFDGDLEAELSRRSGIWIELERSDTTERGAGMVFVFSGREWSLRGFQRQADRATLDRFFGTDDLGPTERRAIDEPWLVWAEPTRPFLDARSGDAEADYVMATLVSSLSALSVPLVSASPEVGAFVYLLLVVVFLVTLNVYILALLMAGMMILGLSRAVNRLTEATRRVQSGDFSARIEVFRRDQLGALQSSFNGMTANLERLVADATQKEIFERELQMAQQMQQGLLPDTLDAPEPLRFAAYFRPSRAIGGDYYDLLKLPDGRLAVVVADVSGHGLPAGLRMAMVKSALEVLCQESSDPVEILSRLHHLLSERLDRAGPGEKRRHRAFVTATFAAIDARTGEMEWVAAGHPPSYLLRRGKVRELAMSSLPLGAALPPTLATRRLRLEPDDVVVWLSDGLVEATNGRDQAFGYERVSLCLEGRGADVEDVKKGILEAVAAHYADGGQLDDDLTLVVMACGPFPDEQLAEPPASGSPSTKPRSAKPRSEKPQSEKPRSEKPRSEKPRSEKPRSEKPRSAKAQSAGTGHPLAASGNRESTENVTRAEGADDPGRK